MMIEDLANNYPEISDIRYNEMVGMDLLRLHQMIERKKISLRMERAAILIQRNFRQWTFQQFCTQKSRTQNKAARKI